MFKYFAKLAFLGMGAIGSSGVAAVGDTAADPVRVHTLSLQVSVEGRELMAPVFEMSSAASAQLSIGTGGDDDYTLVVGIVDNVEPAEPDAVAAHFVLWRGQPEHGVRILDDVVGLGGAQQRNAGERALRSIGSDVAKLTVISHATQLKTLPGKKVRAACADLGTSGAESSVPLRAVAKSNCCSTKCEDGSGSTLKCCNVISGCCGCGSCCSIP